MGFACLFQCKKCNSLFMVEGDTENDFYIDELNFWGVNDTPVSFVSSPDTSDSFAVGIVMIVSAAAAAVAVSKVKKHK